VRRAAWLVAACVAIPAACVDYEGAVDPAHGLPDVVVEAPQFGRDILPIVERRCAIGGCHTVGTRQAGLVLARDSVPGTLINRPSRLAAGEVLVRPGDASGSWLAAMIGSDAARRGAFPRMPLASGALTPNQVATIVNWINRGAPND